MTQDGEVRERTVKRFLECEAKRVEARAAALAQGKSESYADEAAFEASKCHWNVWAEDILTKREALKASDLWMERNPNAETRVWIEEAKDGLLAVPLFPHGDKPDGRDIGRKQGAPRIR